MGRSSVKEKDMGWRKIKRALRHVDGKSVTVGLHEEDAGEGDPSNAEKGYYNEFGTEHIPARPFLRSTHDSKKLEWVRRMQRDFGLVLGNRMTGQRMLESVGKLAASDVHQAVIDWDTPPNAPRTVQKKGFDDPLVETGEMAEAIDYKVRG